jgi:zinc transport system substrate-binding protein
MRFAICLFISIACAEFAHALPTVTTSAIPLAGLLERLCQTVCEATALIQANKEPDAYDPTPKEIRAAAKSSLYFSTGLPFEENIGKTLIKMNPSIRMISWGASLSTADRISSDEHDHGHGHDHGHHHVSFDPHLWTSPKILSLLAKSAVVELKQTFPTSSATLDKNSAEVEKELSALKTEIEQKLSPFRGEKIWTFHGAWAYLLRDVGIEQIAIEQHGRGERSARQFETLMKTAKSNSVKFIFITPQTQHHSADELAKRLGAQVQKLDPMKKDFASAIRDASSAFEVTLK